MFEKTKARIARFEETHDNFRAAHQHMLDHREAYIAVPVALGAGYLLRGKFQSPDMEQIIKTNPSNRGLLYKSSQVIHNTLVQEMVRQGEPGRKTLWVEKQIWFPSRGLAAQAADVSKSSVSKCCNGIIDSVKNQHFVDGGDMI
jgi:hypothetical protein